MASYLFIWDDDEGGNVAHLADHDVTPEEAAYVVEHPVGQTTNRRGEPVAFGYTRAGRHLAAAYWFVDESRTTVYVETAYDTQPRLRRR